MVGHLLNSVSLGEESLFDFILCAFPFLCVLGRCDLCYCGGILWKFVIPMYFVCILNYITCNLGISVEFCFVITLFALTS